MQLIYAVNKRKTNHMGLFPLLRAVRHLQFSQRCNWMHHLWPWHKLSNGFLLFFIFFSPCFCHPSCHTVMVMVYLSPFWPEAVLIKALNIRESTQENWRRGVMAVCSLDAHSVWLRDLVNIAISKGHSRWCPAYVESEQALLNTTELTQHQCRVSFGWHLAISFCCHFVGWRLTLSKSFRTMHYDDFWQVHTGFCDHDTFWRSCKSLENIM